jgi:sporulation protein YlmC with PRC-barrel domain
MNITTDRNLLLSTGSLTGTKIVNLDGEDLGTLDEIMLHADSGDVAYAVVSFGGFLGMGDKLFAVPWDALTVDTAEHRIVLDIDRERLENAPGFDKDDWPTTAETGWMTDLYRHYGSTYQPRNASRRDSADAPFAPLRKQ